MAPLNYLPIRAQHSRVHGKIPPHENVHDLAHALQPLKPASLTERRALRELTTGQMPRGSTYLIHHPLRLVLSLIGCGLVGCRHRRGRAWKKREGGMVVVDYKKGISRKKAIGRRVEVRFFFILIFFSFHSTCDLYHNLTKKNFSNTTKADGKFAQVVEDGYSLWDKVATAASTLTVSVSKAWQTKVTTHEGESMDGSM